MLIFFLNSFFGNFFLIFIFLQTINETESSVSTSQRSRTLPVGSLPSQMHSKSSAKHIRSLSESKTTDGITGMASTTNRTRFNSGDSNTSGVSSSDSVNNTKTVISKFVN